MECAKSANSISSQSLLFIIIIISHPRIWALHNTK